jgi:C_GCAxxG_C_C family probable redox protein
MKLSSNKDGHTIEEVSRLIGHRAGNLFRTRQLWCSSAVLVTLNHGLDGDLTQDQAIRLAAGMGEGMGGSGCICGGLSAGVLALGLFIGTGRLSPGGDQRVIKATKWLHDEFKKAHGSACCKVLMKKDMSATKAKYLACAHRTSHAAQLSAASILHLRPELIQNVDWDYLKKKEGMMSARIKIVVDKLRK